MADKSKALKKAESYQAPAYTSTYADRLENAVRDTSTNYKDANTNYDRLYKSYQDAYMTEAQKAKTGIVNYANRLGTNGKTTGYGQSVTDQQTQQYLTEMNRLNPVFEQLAYEEYQGQLADAYNRANLFQNLDNADYGRYRDNITDNLLYRDYLMNNFQYANNMDLSKKKVKQDLNTANKDFYLTRYRDLINEQAQKEAEAKAKGSGGGGRGGYGGGGYGGGSYGSGSYGSDSDTSATTSSYNDPLFAKAPTDYDVARAESSAIKKINYAINDEAMKELAKSGKQVVEEAEKKRKKNQERRTDLSTAGARAEKFR